MCEAEVQAVRGRYPQLSYLGVLIVTAHEKWCRPQFILPLKIMGAVCAVPILVWAIRHAFS